MEGENEKAAPASGTIGESPKKVPENLEKEVNGSVENQNGNADDVKDVDANDAEESKADAKVDVDDDKIDANGNEANKVETGDAESEKADFGNNKVIDQDETGKANPAENGENVADSAVNDKDENVEIAETENVVVENKEITVSLVIDEKGTLSI